tara:strand:- start:306 stop:761 length:456 start_codon:yes stop_codon:yes gene_type:complete
MGTSMFIRPAVEEEVDGKIITKRVSLKKTTSGALVKFVEFVEDEENSTVSLRAVQSEVVQQNITEAASEAAVEAAETKFVVEDLSEQIDEEKAGIYNLSAVPRSGTMSVYLNGQLINDAVSMNGSSGFSIITDVHRAVYVGGSLFAMYVEG